MKTLLVVLFFSTLAMAGDFKNPTFEEVMTWAYHYNEFDEYSGLRITYNPDKCSPIKAVRLYVNTKSGVPNEIPMYWYEANGKEYIFFWNGKKYVPAFNYREFWYTDTRRE